MRQAWRGWKCLTSSKEIGFALGVGNMHSTQRSAQLEHGESPLHCAVYQLKKCQAET